MNAHTMTEPHVAITYRLTGTGWSEARLAIGHASVTLTASYLDDALGDLVRGAVALGQAESTVRVSWAEEPGEFRWVLDRVGDDVAVRVLWFDSLWGGEPDEKGRVLLDERCSLDDFRRAVAHGARAVLAEWGEEGYRNKWAEHEFPTAALTRLEASLSSMS